MGVQKGKRSKARTHKKRSAWSKMTSVKTMTCPNCDAKKLPHRVCKACGFYDGREIGAKEVATTADIAAN